MNEVAARGFTVKVVNWGRTRLVALHDGSIFFQAATCYPCPVCNHRVDVMKAALSSTETSDYEVRVLDRLAFFVFPAPGGESSPPRAVEHLNCLLGGEVELKLVVDQGGEALRLPVHRRVGRVANNMAQPLFDRTGDKGPVTVSGEGSQASWTSDEAAAWVPLATTAFYGGVDGELDFELSLPSERQMGVGFLLVPVNWGFFGYLGASSTGVAYDPSCGAIVSNTRAVMNGPRTVGESGMVTLRLLLADARGPDAKYAQFVVDGTALPLVKLPGDAVVMPAVCMHHRGQSVRLSRWRPHPQGEEDRHEEAAAEGAAPPAGEHAALRRTAASPSPAPPSDQPPS